MSIGRGLFLDLDGTLANSHEMLARVYQRLLDAVGAGEDAPTFAEAAALTLPQIVAGLCAARPDLDTKELLSSYEQWVVQGYAEVMPHEGARELLDWARAGGIRTAVVTSAHESPSQRWLEARGLWTGIDVLVGRDSAARTKPDPAPYLHALDLTGCDPARSACIEDSAGGARAACDAGLATYVLGATPKDPKRWPPVAGFLTRLLDVREFMPRG